MTTCAGCGDTFIKNSNAQKYCTFKCGDKLRSKAYRDRHVEELKHRRSVIYAWKKDVLLERARNWRLNNSGWIRDYMRRYSLTYRPRARAKFREWYRQHSREWKSVIDNRRAQKLHRVSRFERLTPVEWECLIEAWDYKCAYCGQQKILTQDHMTPLSRGGEHTIENVVPACLSCNSGKGTKTFEEYIGYLHCLEVEARYAKL